MGDHRNLINITDLSAAEIDHLIEIADDIIADPVKYQDMCAHKKLATLFFEPSTRTRLSLMASPPPRFRIGTTLTPPFRSARFNRGFVIRFIA